MANFRISWEIDLDAVDSIDAARIALNIMRDKNCEVEQFYVQNVETNEISLVDFKEFEVLPVGNYSPMIKPLFATKVFYTVEKLVDCNDWLTGDKLITLYKIINGDIQNIGSFDCTNEENTEFRISSFLNDDNIDLVLL